VGRYGSDVVVEILDRLGIRYASLNPGASLRGLHDSLARASRPELVLTTDEGVAVAIAHGYAKAAGEPMAVLLHDLVGLQNGSLGIFNAWADQVPMLVLGGSGPADAARRRPWIDWIHATRSQGLVVRDYVKWDNEPASVQAMVSSLVRAHRLARATPNGPTYVALDALLQEEPAPDVPFEHLLAPRVNPITAPMPDLEQLADHIMGAERPVILADFVGRSSAGYEALIALAEALAAPVVDLGSRHNFPSDHWADGTEHQRELLQTTDLVVALDVRDLRWAISEIDIESHGSHDLVPAGTPVVGMSLTELMHRGFNDRESVVGADLMLLADTSVALPVLASLVADRAGDRRAKRDELEQRLLAPGPRQVLPVAGAGSEGPVTRARLAAELGALVPGGPWQLAHGILGGWARRAWPFTSWNCYLGSSGGGGLGYGVGATLGAALAHRDDDTLVLDLQPDGDLLYTASGLWTAAHHRLPALFVVVNNRTYGKDRLHQQTVARLRGRPELEPSPGIDLDDPPVDFAALASSQGVEGIGPIVDTGELSKALARAVAAARDERRPMLVDVVVERGS
jgi:benzoylformate decarboxylase/acetolactate synthase-1/2/3 large subunit